MRILACVSSFAFLMLGISSAPAFDDKGGEAPTYTVQLEDCATKGSSCGDCYTTATSVNTSICASGIRCDAIGCTNGVTTFKACTSGASSTGNCTSSKNQAFSGCSGCATYQGTCLSSGTCTSPGCNGTPMSTNSPQALLCP